MNRVILHNQKYLAGLIILICLLYSGIAGAIGVQPRYCSILINLNTQLGKTELQALNTQLYEAAIHGKVRVYKNDSLLKFYAKDELLKLDSGSVNITNSISFKLLYDDDNNFSLEFTGFTLNFDSNRSTIIEQFIIAKYDLIKLIGQEETSRLFANCYKAMLITINSDKTITSDSLTCFNLFLGNFLGNEIIRDINNKVQDEVIKEALLKSIDTTVSAIPLYKTNKLTETYKSEEASFFSSPYYGDSVYYLIDMELSKEGIWRDGPMFSPISHIDEYSLLYTWSYDKDKTIAKANISAFSLYVNLHDPQEIKYSYNYIWVNWNDAQQIFTSTEIAVLKYAIYRAFADFGIYKTPYIDKKK